jgi:hypothetical protein
MQLPHGVRRRRGPSVPDRKPVARAASVPRSHRGYWPQGRRFNPAGFSFGFGCGKLLTLAFRPLCSRRRWPQKPGSPSPFELSLQVERNNAHNPNSGGHDPAPGTDFNAHRVLKVLNGAAGISASVGSSDVCLYVPMCRSSCHSSTS